MDRVEVAVVGAGQAGLAVSHELTSAGVEHVVLERGRVGQAWRDRWDSFCLVTPNWSVQLPGGRYQGADPDGYLPRDEIVAHLQGYAASFAAPVHEGVEVTSLGPAPDGGFLLRSPAGDLRARSVVVTTGAYQRAHRPPGASSLPPGLPQIDAERYRNPESLPPGGVLVVGSGQSGAQIAEELHEAGRDVVLACGRAPWAPRRLGGLDIFWWVNGVTLTGHFLGAGDGEVRFAPDLGGSVAWGDERYGQLMDLVRRHVAERALEPPDIADPEPFDGRAPERLLLGEFGVVVFAGGFRPDYRSWVQWPEAFDDLGFPIHHDGASTVVDGLYFVGVHFLRKRKSSLLIGVGEDAALVAAAIARPGGA
jgi:putative flavoprotein involved in K+ transport